MSTVNKCITDELGCCCKYYSGSFFLTNRALAGTFYNCTDTSTESGSPVTEFECPQNTPSNVLYSVFKLGLSCAEPVTTDSMGPYKSPCKARGSWLEKISISRYDPLVYLGPLSIQNYIYTCECITGTEAQYSQRLAWDTRVRGDATGDTAGWPSVVGGTWSTEHCRDRTITNSDCTIGDKGSFCMLNGTYNDGKNRWECHVSSEAEFNDIQENATLIAPAFIPFSSNWESLPCSERTKKCHATDACEVKNELGNPNEYVNRKTLQDCTCAETPHPLNDGELIPGTLLKKNGFQDMFLTDKPRRIDTNAKKIYIVDGLDRTAVEGSPEPGSEHPPVPDQSKILGTFEVGECGRAYLCEGDTILKGEKSLPYYLPGWPILTPVTDLRGKVVTEKCEQQGTEKLVECGNHNWSKNIRLPFSTEEACIDSFSKPVKNAAGDTINYYTGNEQGDRFARIVCGPCKTNPNIIWAPGSPNKCGVLTVSNCGNYTKKSIVNGVVVETKYYIYPFLYNINVFIAGWFNIYKPHIQFRLPNNSIVSMNNPPSGCTTLPPV